MLIRLKPEYVSENWEYFKDTILDSIPEGKFKPEQIGNNLLTAVMSEMLIVYMSYQEVDGKNVVDSIMSLMIYQDMVSRSRDLVIYSLFAVKVIPEESWADAYLALSEYARKNNCGNITAYTANNKIRERFETLVGSLDYSYCIIPLI